MIACQRHTVAGRLAWFWVATVCFFPLETLVPTARGWFNGFCTGTCWAADPVQNSIEFDRIDIPEDQPAIWPPEIDRMRPVPRQDFVKLLQQLKARSQGPRAAWLKSAHYEATLVNDTLRGGLMTASVQRLGRESTLLELSPFSFALDDLKWQDRTAIWGSSADGRVWVETDHAKDELLGEWSCRGRSFPGGINFDLQLPPATVSFLDLRAPKRFSLTAPGTEVTLLSDASSEETRLWRIQCGAENRCRITFVSRDDLVESRRVLLCKQDMQVVVREEDLRFQLNIHLEAIDGSVQELVLKVPAGLVIYSASFGSDAPIPIQRTPADEAAGRLAIRLPGPLTGRKRTLRVDGIAFHNQGSGALIPQIMVENSTFDGGQLAVTVQSPLRVKTIHVKGYRQQTTTDGESFTFQQLTADAQLTLEVPRETATRSGQLLSVLEFEEDSWNLTSQILWNSQTGSPYQVSCQFPPEWEVTDVRMIADAESLRTNVISDDVMPTREVPKLNWDVQPQYGGTSKLVVEFLDSIQSGKSRRVKVISRRLPPQVGQTIPVPLPQLLDCDVSDVILGIQIPNSMSPIVSANSRLERIGRPNSNVFSLPPENSSLEQRWYRGDSLDGAGTLEMKPRLKPVHVRTETSIEALPAEFRIKYSIYAEHRDFETDRLLVYLTESSPDVHWIWKGNQPIELSAVRLAQSQHTEWNLPLAGELWEIRLPRAIGRGVAIEGISSNRWAAINRPALVFVPQAVERLSELTLSHPESLDITLETDGLKPTGQPLTWWYSTPQADLRLSLRNPVPSREFPLMLSMQLQTFLSADQSAFDVYRATLQLENGSAQETLRIKFDPGTVLQEAFVNGTSIAATLQSGELIIPELSATRRDVVQLNYRVPADALMIRDRRRIVVPQVSAKVLGFFWEFRIPPSARIFAEPSGIRLSRAIAQPTWSERLFGPLGRSSSESLFYPLRSHSWVELFNPKHFSATSFGEVAGQSVSPIEWQVHQAVAPDVPLDITIELWHAARIQLLMWISLGACLSLGIIFRLLGWGRRDRIAAYWLGFSLAATIISPAPYVGFLGGSIAGTLISLLIPRQLIRRGHPNIGARENPQRSRTGIIIASILGAMTIGGVSLMRSEPSLAQDIQQEEPPTNKRPIVYVPVDKTGHPSETQTLVYVPQDAFARWKAMAAEQGGEPTYLISSARYQVDGASDRPLSLVATFRVHILVSQDRPVTVELPLAEISLPDTESCRVNGRPHSIETLPNGKGYSVQLAGRVDDNLESVAMPVERGRTDNRITTYEIELRSLKSRPLSSTFDLQLPLVANSRFNLKLGSPTPFINIAGGRGFIDRTMETTSVDGHLGSTANIQVQWGPLEPNRKPTQVTASLLKNLELHPDYGELSFHLSAAISDEGVDALEFELPENAVVRRIQSRSADLLRNDVIVSKNGQRRLRLVFEKRQHGPVIIDGTLVIAQSNWLVESPLPKFDLVTSHGAQIQYDRNWWGISTSVDFRLERANLDRENIGTIASDAYLNAWSSGVDSHHSEFFVPRLPNWAFETSDSSNPRFMLVSLKPVRRATQWKQTGFIGKRRLEWTLVGEIESAQTPTFQTVLLIDGKLRIEKISVMENDADRLVRRSESRGEPSRVVLFLADKTQGKQTITLKASLPLIPGTPIALPSIRAEDCEMADIRLSLTRDPEVDVTFVPPADWKVLSKDDPITSSSAATSPVVLGHFQIPESASRGKIQTSALHSQCSSRATVLLRRTEGNNWQMKYRLEMTPEGDSPMRMGLVFPESFTEFNSVTIERAEPAWHEIHEGTRQLDLLLGRSEGIGTVVVQFQMPLSEPKSRDWELPLPTPFLSNGHETTLVIIDPDSIWFPATGLEVRVADLPDWTEEFYNELPGNAPAFKIPQAQVQMQRDVLTTELREPSVRLLDQRVWLHQHDRCSGVTQVYLSSVRSDLEFQLPSAVEITSLFLDDRPLAMPTSSSKRMTIPLTDARTEALLTITWRVDRAPPKMLMGPLIWPNEIHVERRLTTLVPDQSVALWNRPGSNDIGLLDQGLDRLETLVARHKSLGDETRGTSANRWLLEKWYTYLSSRRPLEIQQHNQAVVERSPRWKAITESINQMEPVPDSVHVSWHARLLQEPVSATQIAIQRGESPEDAIQFWQLDRAVYLWGCFTLMTLLLIPLFRQVIRIEWSEWLHRHVIVSWVLLAAFWWLFLTPSALGPFLLILGIARVAVYPKLEE